MTKEPKEWNSLIFWLFKKLVIHPTSRRVHEKLTKITKYEVTWNYFYFLFCVNGAMFWRELKWLRWKAQTTKSSKNQKNQNICIFEPTFFGSVSFFYQKFFERKVLETKIFWTFFLTLTIMFSTEHSFDMKF